MTTERDVVFADSILEREYRRLRSSGRPAEQRLWAFITKAIEQLRLRADFGVVVPAREIPEFYRIEYGMLQYLKLAIPPNWLVFYTLDGNTIRIIDMTCDGPG